MTNLDDVAIGIGLGHFYDEYFTPEELFAYVERADELGIDSIWMPDHPISESPELDPTVLMTVIAARTDDIKMGPSVLTVPGRNPVEIANEYANLDYLTESRGRVIMAVGLGSNPRFSEVLGVPPKERPKLVREAIDIIRLLWTEDDVHYDGEYYTLNGVTVNPKPANGPLDIWIGGNSDYALKRVAEYGDGWLPSTLTADDFAKKHDQLMQYCEAEGRSIDRDEAGILLRTHVDDDPAVAQSVRDMYLESRERPLDEAVFDECSAFGTTDDCIETIHHYLDAGCTKFILMPVGPASDRIEQIERYGTEVIPAITG